MTPEEMSGALLAYLGDAVIEHYVRKRLMLDGGKVGELNRIADSLVRASFQSRAGEKILPLLTEEEMNAYRSGKNVSHASVPKNATRNEYKRATALEALFGYLDLKGDTERTELLLNEAFFKNDGEQ